MKKKLLFIMVALLSSLGMQAEKYKDYDVFYARGGLVGVGNWADTQEYPLYYVEETGFYEGDVDVVYYTMDDAVTNGWYGCRGDLFFQDPSGLIWGCETNTDRFITPATGAKGLSLQPTQTNHVFQCMGGKYHIALDLTNRRLYASGVDPKWEDFVYVVGTLPEKTWDLGYSGARLEYQGEAVYKGEVQLLAGDSGYGEFLVDASLQGPEDARYAAPEQGTMVRHGESVATQRYFGGNAFFVSPGYYEITFDASEQTIRLRDLTLAIVLAGMGEEWSGLDCGFLQEIADNKEATADQIDWGKAYISLAEKVFSIRQYLAEHTDFSGAGRTMLEEYLEDDYAPGENGYPNGSFIHIWENHTLDLEGVKAELAYVDQLLEVAMKGGLQEGADITAMLKNADLSSEEGWNMTHNGSQAAFGLADGQTMECWNDKSYDMHQTVVDLPNGVYELAFNAYYRPCPIGNGVPAKIVPAKVYINDWAMSVRSIISDAAAEQLHETDYFTDYGYVPNSISGACAAFTAGRYAQKMYGVVANGQMTLGFGYAGDRYEADNWFALRGLKLTYLGQTAEAVDAALEGYKTTVGVLDESVDSYYSSALRTQLGEALEAVAAAAGYEAKVAALARVNQLLKDIDNCSTIYGQMTDAVEKYTGELYVAAESDPSLIDRANEMYAFSDEMWEKVLAGAYTMEEAAAIYAEYADKWREFDVIYACGGLLGIGNWARTDAYPLHFNVETGCYEGEVKFAPRYLGESSVNGDNQYGHRCDLFFIDRNMADLFWAADSYERFLTPTTGEKGLKLSTQGGSGFVPLQVVGGVYNMSINPQTLELHATCVDPGWLEYVYVGGTVIPENTERFEIYSPDHNKLMHQGNGIYTGECVLYAGATGKAEFCVLASTFGAEDAWYSPKEEDVEVAQDTEYAVGRYYNHKMYIEEGRYEVTFNIDRQSVSMHYLGEVEHNEQIVDVIYCRGGLANVGDWAQTTAYPLYNYGDGKYRGSFTIHPNRTTPDCWGNRADVFFEKSDGSTFCGIHPTNRFITPAKNHFEGFQPGTDCVYQCHAGTYDVVIDLEAQTLDLTCTEQAWMDRVFVVGSLVGHNWERTDETYALIHAGEGVYKGVIDVDKDYEITQTAYPEGDHGRFSIFAVYPQNHAENWNEGRYGQSEYVHAGLNTPYEVNRYYGDRACFVLPNGQYAVTFDMNHETVMFAEANGIQNVDFTDDDTVTAYTLDGKPVFEGRMGDLRRKGGVYIIKGNGGARKQALK
ncbi:MAG: hypothetical protein ACI3X9_01190 [Bacteroidaceae bacterium]